mmetsp:Transcript_34965/g.39867  ORF Transcript_34965/g.39867 Transcript_34965/m.39867 type:complete len:183 (+) Transcript_34965:28-576(+)
MKGFKKEFEGMKFGRYVIAAAVIAMMSPVYPFQHPINSRVSCAHNPSSIFMSMVVESKTQNRPKPIVVSEEAEALSHSSTTMKLTPSYELFQILPDDEDGTVPETIIGNALRDPTVLKLGLEDEHDGLQLSDYKGLGGGKKIEVFPDPFKMVEKELQPFSDSIKELVSSDQPILSMAAKHFF